MKIANLLPVICDLWLLKISPDMSMSPPPLSAHPQAYSFLSNFNFLLKNNLSCKNVLSTFMHAWHTRSRKRTSDFLGWSYGLVCTIMWILRIKPRSSAGATGVLNH